MGHRAELLCDPAGELWRRAHAAGLVCHPMPIRNALDAAAAAALRRRLREGRYDVVHFHTSRAHAMAPWVRGLARAAVVTRRMDYVPNRLFARWLYGRRAVDGVAAISTGVADALVRAGVARERITVIPSGVDCAHFRPPTADERAAARAALGLGDADRAVGAVGVLEPRKGHRFLVEAMAMLDRDDAGRPAARRSRAAGRPPYRRDHRRRRVAARPARGGDSAPRAGRGGAHGGAGRRRARDPMGARYFRDAFAKRGARRRAARSDGLRASAWWPRASAESSTRWTRGALGCWLRRRTRMRWLARWRV